MGLQQIPDKLARLRAADRHCLLLGAQVHRYQLNPPLESGAAGRFEVEHGITLPRGYRDFITTIGDGGAGPYYGISTLAASAIRGPLRQPFPFATAANPFEGSDDLDDMAYGKLLAACYSGCLLIGHLGCGHWILLIVSGQQAGTVWFDHTVEDRGFEPTGLDFVAWYQRWLDELLVDHQLADRLERNWRQMNCLGFPWQCPVCYGNNIESSEGSGPGQTVVVTTWSPPGDVCRSIRFRCRDCGYSVEQVS